MAVKETAENCRKSGRPFSVAGVLKSLGVSLSGYKSFLKWKLPEQKKKKAEVQQQITEIHKDSRQIYGAPKIAKELKKKGYGTSERTVSVYMKEMGLKACWIKKWHAVPKVKLDSTKLKNLLKQKFNPKRPDAVWCTDITYIWTSEGFMYLSTIMDLFSRKIIDWELSRTMEEEFVIKTVEKAKTERKIKRPLIIHSDRGSHYKADAYIKATEKMKRSYSKVHYPYDNACIESFHSLIKREWLYRFQIQGYEHCRSLVFEYIETFYNTKRIHSHCGFTSPNEYEAKFKNKKSEKCNKKAV